MHIFTLCMNWEFRMGHIQLTASRGVGIVVVARFESPRKSEQVLYNTFVIIWKRDEFIGGQHVINHSRMKFEGHFEHIVLAIRCGFLCDFSTISSIRLLIDCVRPMRTKNTHASINAHDLVKAREHTNILFFFAIFFPYFLCLQVQCMLWLSCLQH